MRGRIGGAIRSVADDSLSIRQMHCVSFEQTLNNPVKFSLQNNCTVLAIELKTSQLLILWVKHDLDLLELHLWLGDLKGGPVVA